MEYSLRDIVQKARVKKDISLRAAAKEMGFSAMYLSQIESGKSIPSENILEKIANFYGLDFFELLNAAHTSDDSDDGGLRMKAARQIYNMPDEEFKAIVSSILKVNTEKRGDNG